MSAYHYLIRVPNHLGDAVMAQPAIVAFVKARQDSKIALLLPDWAGPLYHDVAGVDLIYVPSDYLHGFAGILYQSRLLRKNKFDTGAVLTPSFSSALVLFLGKVKRRYGYVGEGRKLLLNYPVRLSKNAALHRAEKYKQLLEKVAGVSLEISLPRIYISENEKQKARDMVGKQETGRYIVMAPQAVAESRRWGGNNYSRLARLLKDNFSLKIVLIGTQNEFTAGETIAQDDSDIINLCGRTDIARAAAILAGAGLFVGNDSGPAHLASAVDIPLVVLSGADNPAETSPLSNRKDVLIKDSLECISCVKNRCPEKGDDFMRCMKEITVAEVYEAAAKRLNS